jgi:hypothetical protein
LFQPYQKQHEHNHHVDYFAANNDRCMFWVTWDIIITVVHGNNMDPIKKLGDFFSGHCEL